MDAQRRAATGKPASTSQKKRPYGSDLTGSSARGSEDRSSAVPQGPRGTKRGRELEGIDKVSSACHLSLTIMFAVCFVARTLKLASAPELTATSLEALSARTDSIANSRVA